MSNPAVYPGKELESMSFAVNYHKWILDEFRPYIGEHFVEVGAGTGCFSRLLLNENPRTANFVEPSQMFFDLEKTIEGAGNGTRIGLYHATFETVASRFILPAETDSIFYINVLEHIEDDFAELKLVYDSLAPGGKCFIFVPALMALFGNFDRAIGHFRRYSKSEIERKVVGAGFTLRKSIYFDVLGVVPWFVKYKVFRSNSLDGKSVSLYDRFGVPATRYFERLLPPVVGKSILLVGEK